MSITVLLYYGIELLLSITVIIALSGAAGAQRNLKEFGLTSILFIISIVIAKTRIRAQFNNIGVWGKYLNI